MKLGAIVSQILDSNRSPHFSRLDEAKTVTWWKVHEPRQCKLRQSSIGRTSTRPLIAVAQSMRLHCDLSGNFPESLARASLASDNHANPEIRTLRNTKEFRYEPSR